MATTSHEQRVPRERPGSTQGDRSGFKDLQRQAGHYDDIRMLLLQLLSKSDAVWLYENRRLMNKIEGETASAAAGVLLEKALLRVFRAEAPDRAQCKAAVQLARECSGFGSSIRLLPYVVAYETWDCGEPPVALLALSSLAAQQAMDEERGAPAMKLAAYNTRSLRAVIETATAKNTCALMVYAAMRQLPRFFEAMPGETDAVCKDLLRRVAACPDAYTHASVLTETLLAHRPALLV